MQSPYSFRSRKRLMLCTMTKKRVSTSAAVCPPVGPKTTAALCAVLLALAILILHSHEFSLQSSSFTSRITNQGFGDNHGVQSPPKLAFLFLARQNLPLDFLWHHFFKNGDTAKFSIYIHSQPGFVYDKSTTKSSFFYGRQLKNTVQVVWGESSMIEAERLLFRAALDDPANQRFVLLSDSCVPLHNFSHTYSYLMSSSKSFVDSFLNINEGRYNPEMSPAIPMDKWRKGSQWVTLVRRHAQVVVDDAIIFHLFKNFCKRWRPPTELTTRRQLLETDLKIGSQKLKVHPNCIPDEHYVQTLLSIRGLENELERRTLTYSSWIHPATKRDRRTWHPITFHYSDATPEKITEIKKIDHIDYASEHRTEWCRINSTYTPCFLFARKFTVGAALRLLNGRSGDPVGGSGFQEPTT